MRGDPVPFAPFLPQSAVITFVPRAAGFIRSGRRNGGGKAPSLLVRAVDFPAFVRGPWGIVAVRMRSMIAWLVVTTRGRIAIAMVFSMMSDGVWAVSAGYGPHHDPMLLAMVLSVPFTVILTGCGSRRRCGG